VAEPKLSQALIEEATRCDSKDCLWFDFGRSANHKATETRGINRIENVQHDSICRAFYLHSLKEKTMEQELLDHESLLSISDQQDLDTLDELVGVA